MTCFIHTGFCPLFALAAVASDAIKPRGFYIEPATFHSLGFQWNMTAGENRNATVAVSYRSKGSGQWRDALDLQRIKSEVIGADVRKQC